MKIQRASTSCTFYKRWTRSCFAFQLFVSFPCLPCSALPVILFLSSSFASSILPPPSSPSSKRGGTAKCPERVGFGSSKQSWLSSFPPEYLRYWDQATDCPTPCIGRCHHFTVCFNRPACVTRWPWTWSNRAHWWCSNQSCSISKNIINIICHTVSKLGHKSFERIITD